MGFRRLLPLSFALSLIACGSSSDGDNPSVPTTTPTPTPVPEPNPTVTLNTATTHQTLQGFGASLAWYGDLLLTHPDAEQLQDVVFGQLGLDILRLRNRYQRTNEAVNFGNELALIEAATASLGRQPAILMSSWSPPATLKANANDDCTGNNDCTLKKENGGFVYEAFGQYWRDSLEHYHGQGIVPNWISIQNEPSFIPNGWEGSKFTTTEGDYPAYGTALTAVANALDGMGNRPGLLGAENLGAHYNTEADFQAHLDQSLLAGVAHHLYERGNDGIWDWRDPGPDSYIDPMLTVVDAANNLPIFMTEFQTDEDGGHEGGFETAWLIHNSLVEANNAAWLYWDLIWPNDTGLVAVGSSNYRIRDQYYALRHYSLYTDPGYQRIQADSSDQQIRASAFMAPNNQRVTVILLNVGDTEETIALDPGTYSYTVVSGYRTTYVPEASSTWEVITGFGEDLTITLPSRSQVTVVLEN